MSKANVRRIVRPALRQGHQVVQARALHVRPLELWIHGYTADVTPPSVPLRNLRQEYRSPGRGRLLLGPPTVVAVATLVVPRWRLLATISSRLAVVQQFPVLLRAAALAFLEGLEGCSTLWESTDGGRKRGTPSRSNDGLSTLRSAPLDLGSPSRDIGAASHARSFSWSRLARMKRCPVSTLTTAPLARIALSRANLKGLLTALAETGVSHVFSTNGALARFPALQLAVTDRSCRSRSFLIFEI